jgi:hypothetical protein
MGVECREAWRETTQEEEVSYHGVSILGREEEICDNSGRCVSKYV